MSISKVLFFAVFLLSSIAIRCALGDVIESEVATPCSLYVTKSTTFVAESDPKNPTNCSQTIRGHSIWIRQLRVVFTTRLAQPTYSKVNGSLECVDEYFEIGGRRFCGTENRQHIYLPFDNSRHIAQILLTVRLMNRSGTNVIPHVPSWDITVIQLESHSPIFAPIMCQQYYKAERGNITSFNYNGGRGIYASNMNYTICIRRPEKSTALKLKFKNFDICDDDNCDVEQSPGLYCNYEHNEGYVWISSSVILPLRAEYFNDNYYCGHSLRNATVLSLPFDRESYEIRVFSGMHNSINRTGFEFEYGIVKEV